MHEPDKIKRRPDGSIDSGHYLAVGRRCRSRLLRRHCRSLLALLGTRRVGHQVTGTNSPVSASRASSSPVVMPK